MFVTITSIPVPAFADCLGMSEGNSGVNPQ
jgi:hypothetical protein